MEPWEVRAEAREPWAPPSGQSWAPKGPVVSHMEAQGRPRRIPDAEMGPQRAKMESQGSQKASQGSQKGSKGSPKRAKRRAKWTPRGSWKDAACDPTINGKHKQNNGFVRFGQPAPSQKGSEKCPMIDPAARGKPRDPKEAAQDPNRTPKRTPREPVSSQMEAQGRPRTLPDAEMDPQRFQMDGQWEPKGVQRLAKESRREGKMEPGSEYKGNRAYETNLRKP